MANGFDDMNDKFGKMVNRFGSNIPNKMQAPVRRATGGSITNKMQASVRPDVKQRIRPVYSTDPKMEEVNLDMVGDKKLRTTPLVEGGVPVTDVTRPPETSVRPADGRMEGPYEITDSTWNPAEAQRFGTQPTRPGTQMVRTGRPEGGWSPDYQKSWNKQKESIEPPRSIGDLIRYKREIAERNRMMGYADKSRRTDILDREAGQRTGIAQMKASGDAQRQSAKDARQAEYDDPNTTPERRKDLERSMAYRAGKPLTEKAPEPRKGVYVEEWNPATERMEQVLKDPWLGAKKPQVRMSRKEAQQAVKEGKFTPEQFKKHYK